MTNVLLEHAKCYTVFLPFYMTESTSVQIINVNSTHPFKQIKHNKVPQTYRISNANPTGFLTLQIQIKGFNFGDIVEIYDGSTIKDKKLDTIPSTSEDVSSLISSSKDFFIRSITDKIVVMNITLGKIIKCYNTIIST